MIAADLAPFLAHGGRIEAARAVFGGADWIDLSTGIAPWAWPAATVPAGYGRLPEPQALARLEAAAADAFAVADAARVVAVPGTDLALRLLATLLPARSPAVVMPGYAGHRAAWPAAAAIGWDTLADSRHDPIVLASPANPDGRIADPALLASLAAHGTLVLDQAYADPSPVAAPDDAVVLRSFGKFYGLPGVRLGFVIAPQAIAARLRALLGDWPVSTSAIAIGCRAYRDTAWRRAQSARIAAAGAALDAVLAAAGLAAVGAAPLFRYVACPDATALFRALAGHAILIRAFADSPDRVRIGLPADAAATARLAAALQEYPR